MRRAAIFSMPWLAASLVTWREIAFDQLPFLRFQVALIYTIFLKYKTLIFTPKLFQDSFLNEFLLWQLR